MKVLVYTLTALLLLGWLQVFALTPQEEEAARPADLGEVNIDVSSYSKEQQDNFRLFLSKCARCHSPARPLYSRIVTHEAWQHFVALMHGRLESRGMKPGWTTEDGRRIVDFLAYDSQIRKVEHRAAFEEYVLGLQTRYQEVQKAKAERAKHQPTKPSAPYTGANP